MTDPEIDRNRMALIEGGMIIVAAVVFAITVWIMDEPPASWGLDKNPTQPVEIRYLPIPEPLPLHPSYLIDWPLSERIVGVSTEEEEADKEPPAPADEPVAEEKEEPSVERGGHRRHRWRYRRHWRRRW